MQKNNERGISVNLMLGSACNWNCPYCLQTEERGFRKKPNLDWFIENFRRYIIENSIKIRRIAFWGGEPCLYWNEIKEIDGACRDICSSPARFITNGSLITDEQVNYFNKHDTLVNVSYHTGELCDSQWIKCLKIHNLYVTSLINHKCLTYEPYWEKWKYLWDTYGRCVSWYVFPMKYTPGVPKEWALTHSDIDSYTEYLFSIIEKAHYDPFYRRMIEILFYTFYEKDYDNEYQNFCYNKNVLSIDLFGNKYFCHHDCSSDNIVGNIFNPLSIFKDQTFLDQLPSHRKQCQNCPLFKHCLGGCFRDVDRTVSCYGKLKLYNFLCFVKRNYSYLVDKEFLEYIEL